MNANSKSFFNSSNRFLTQITTIRSHLLDQMIDGILKKLIVCCAAVKWKNNFFVINFKHIRLPNFDTCIHAEIKKLKLLNLTLTLV